MARVVVTGGNGFVGGWCIRRRRAARSPLRRRRHPGARRGSWRRALLPLLGRALGHRSTKAQEQLGWTCRPAVETIVDTGRSVVALRATVA